MKNNFSAISYSKFLNNENITLDLNKDDDAFKCAIQNINSLKSKSPFKNKVLDFEEFMKGNHLFYLTVIKNQLIQTHR